MDLSALYDFGLSENEVKIYIALLDLGSAKAGEIIKMTGIQNSVMHLTLGRLVEKGILSFVKDGKFKLYYPTEPKNLISIFDHRKTKLEILTKELSKIHQRVKLPEAEVYKGLTGLKNMCYQLIDQVKKGDEFLFFAFINSNAQFEDEVYDFYREYTVLRKERGIVLKGIAHSSLKQRFTEYKRPYPDLLFVDYPTLQNMSVFQNSVIFTPWDSSKLSFKITSQPLANNLRSYFNSIWDGGIKKRKKYG